MPASTEGTFAEIAHSFCAWCEGPSLGVEPETSATAAAWLAKLYAAAIALPKVKPDSESGLPGIPEEALAKARTNLAWFNGWYYREFFDPDPTVHEEPVMGEIGDDLLDTYKDVKAGYLLYERGEIAEALWHWSFLYRIHWGRHAAAALFALHCFSVSKQE
jgi:hypothetical protein